ncbi:MAG: DUF1549 domain-containing protein, partial [Pirellulales bacterium]
MTVRPQAVFGARAGLAALALAAVIFAVPGSSAPPKGVSESKAPAAKAAIKAPAAKAPLKLAGEANYFGVSQVKKINELIRQGWSGHGVSPSKPASDGEWCRRVYLDIIGRVPSVGELDQYLKEKGPDAREKLVSRLLSDEYAEDYTRNWTTIWTNILIGRNGGT